MSHMAAESMCVRPIASGPANFGRVKCAHAGLGRGGLRFSPSWGVRWHQLSLILCGDINHRGFCAVAQIMLYTTRQGRVDASRFPKPVFGFSRSRRFRHVRFYFCFPPYQTSVPCVQTSAKGLRSCASVTLFPCTSFSRG